MHTIPPDFAAIDFETATGRRDSACAIGIVVVRGGVITDEFMSLIQPPGNEYLGWNIRIHGIRPAHTAQKPHFDGVWSEILSRIQGLPIAAHNASFDRSVLYHSAARYGIDAESLFPKPVWLCTMNLYKALGYVPYSLDACCGRNCIELNHHEALSDARGCALLALKAGGYR